MTFNVTFTSNPLSLYCRASYVKPFRSGLMDLKDYNQNTRLCYE